MIIDPLLNSIIIKIKVLMTKKYLIIMRLLKKQIDKFSKGIIK